MAEHLRWSVIGTGDKFKFKWILFDFEGPEKETQFLMWGFSSAGRAPALQAGGQGFDSLNLHHMGQ